MSSPQGDAGPVTVKPRETTVNPREVTAEEFAPKVKPRPRLFAALCVIFVLWIGLLVTLYVLTVYPRRHSSPPLPVPAGQTP